MPNAAPDETLWLAIHEQRQALAQDLAELTETQWRTPSLCAQWDVEQVVAHLTAAASTTRGQWMRSMLAAGFRPAVHNERRLAEHLGPSPADTFAAFRAVVTNSIAPTGDLPAFLGEVVVHAQDIREPLGIATTPPVEALTQVAEFFASRDFAVKSRTAARGLRLRATDGPFDTGTDTGTGARSAPGPEITGSTLALVMAMAGRSGFLDRLDGDGVEVLRQRLG